ncbi:MAG: carboxypeptidase regulatory-like domain-containing protein [Acidobacteriia bacterium]|nr:carboxypeptidase regulatory-like domain-containing protein [Terriglobia bacterium]
MRFPLQRCLSSVTLVALLAMARLHGQTLGTVTGQVKDSTTATVTGAHVTVRNIATNGVRAATTNEDGAYTIPALVPGMYEVKAEKPGFKVATRTNIELQVQQTARVDFALEVGQVSETVEVTSAVPLLTTENATVGTVIEKRRITDLPLNGRNFLSLVALSPNVTYGFNQAAQAAGRQGGTRSQLTMSLAGARSAWSNYTLDGITNTDINFNLYIVLPSVEAIQEFKVQTGIYPAEFGRAAGQINVSTLGGSNAYHGSAFEFLRNDRLDARPYFFKDPESPTQTAPVKQPYRQNQYGFTLAGPVQIPKLLNGKDRLFFMANYEGFKSRTTGVNFFTTMTPAMRAGDFSVVPTALQDPNTRVRTPNASGSGFTVTSTPFAGNQIPVSRFNPGGVYLVNDFAPLPNLPQTGLPNRNYQYVAKTPVDKDQVTGRIDFNESSTSQWFGRYSWTDESTVTPGVKLNGSVLYTRASQWVVANTRVFSSSKVNEFRFGYNSMFNNISQELANVLNVNEKLGTPVKVDDPNSWGVPNISLSGSTLSSFGNDANGPFSIDNKVYQLVDNFSWVKGKHSFRFGGDWRYNQFLQIGNEFARSRFTSNGSFTGNGNTLAGGYNGADLLMGNLSVIESAVALARGDFRNHEIGFYVDDTYKLTPRLTINWGVRYELAQPLLDNFGLLPNFQLKQSLPSIANDPNVNNHPVFVRTGSGDFYEGLAFRFTGPVQLARDGRLGNRLISTDFNNFAPRLGIAFSPSNKWAIRAGFGVFYSQESKNSIFDMSRAAGGRANPPIDLQGVPSVTYQNFINTSQLPVSFAAGLTWGADYNLRNTYTMQYLFNIQRAIGNNTTFEAGYTGNGSRKVNYLVNANAPLPGITPFDAREPYPEWHGIQFLNGDGIANYNALSGKLSQRFGSSLTTLFSYTWSKALDENSAIRGTGSDFTLANQRCRSCDRGPAGYNIPHRFVTSVLFALPFGKGRSFLDHGGVVNQIVGGWQVSTITVIQSGTSINPDSWDSSGMGAGFPHSNRLHCVAGVNPVADNPTSDRYFVREAFRNTVAGEFGNCGRNSLIAPSTWNIDFSTMKDFRINENHALQFRMEMFNAPNHPAWGRPNAAWGSQGVNPAASFGRIRSTTQLRQIQFALKYHF